MRQICLVIGLIVMGASSAAALDLTPSQTEGPYYPRQKPAETDSDLTRVGAGPVAKGDVMALTGKVVDPTGAAIAGARVEIWQTDHQGIYLHPGDGRVAQRDKNFQSYGETRTGEDGGFSFRTIVPALYPGRSRHIHAKITHPGRGHHTAAPVLEIHGQQALASQTVKQRNHVGIRQPMVAKIGRAHV